MKYFVHTINLLVTDEQSMNTLGFVPIMLLRFLNQACAGHRLARAWFLKVGPVQIISMCVYMCVCVCMCLPPRLLITSDMMWHDKDPYNWLNNSYS